MYGIIISIHVISGVLAIVASFSRIFPFLSRLKQLFMPSIIAVSSSGFLLIFSGVSIARVCISGVLLTAGLIVIRLVPIRQLSSNKTEKKN